MPTAEAEAHDLVAALRQLRDSGRRSADAVKRLADDIRRLSEEEDVD